MKSLFRCTNYHYSIQNIKCSICGDEMKHPYPARFSIDKERKYRHLVRKITKE